MTERDLLDTLLVTWFGLGAVVAIALFFINAPYGRHNRAGFGLTVSSSVGWVLMEAPAALLPVLFFVTGTRMDNAVAWFFLAAWETHYIYRAFIFPFLRRGGQRPMPLAIVASGFFFNCVNGYLNGRWLFALADPYPLAWFLDVRFILGITLFVAGLAIHVQSDSILRHLRTPGETGYKIPQGGLFRYVSSPNYLGEMVEWSGWALMTWCLPTLAFTYWTAANLLPRALANHRWYREHFPDYPSNRHALIPFIY